MTTINVKANSPLAGQMGTKLDDGCVFTLSGGELVRTTRLHCSYSRCESGAECAAGDSKTVPFVSNPRQDMGGISSSKYRYNLACLYKKLKPIIYLFAFLAGWACYWWQIRHAERKQANMINKVENQAKTGLK
jgi:hypothetical protein